jgi:hypothetical protein
MSKNLLFFNSGPMISYRRDSWGEYLVIEDLNPQTKITWKLTPIQLFKFGLKCLWAAIGG